MSDHKTASLRWTGGERFEGTAGVAPIVLDGSADGAPSPMDALLASLGGCMGIDVAMILEKGRQDLRGLEVDLVGRRAEKPPRRFVACTLHFRVEGDVDEKAVQRAVDLSRDKYCSVMHSLAPDTEIECTFEIVAAD